jgi:peptidoglycan DL-endopeptidase CwlO
VLSSVRPRAVASGLAVVAATTVTVLGLLPGIAVAQEETDGEGGTQSLRQALDEASSAYQDAQSELEESEEREQELQGQLESLEDERDELAEEIQVTAVTAYQSGRIGPVSALLNSNSPTDFLERATALEIIAQRENEQMAKYNELSEEIAEQQAAIAEEIALQETEVAKLEAAVKEAEDALFSIGGGTTGQFTAFPSEDASPAPRNPDGSLPSESCSEPDPTTSGCLTPRTLHALNEMQVFGFTRYTSCWRSGTFGEHPLGRACDMAAQPNGFGGVATGVDKEYGDRLASFLVHNASALGVQYVIWYRQIWINGSWRAYSGAGGDPSSDHTNHVHVSIR